MNIKKKEEVKFILMIREGGIQKKKDVRKSGYLGKTNTGSKNRLYELSLHDAKLSEVLPLFVSTSGLCYAQLSLPKVQCKRNIVFMQLFF